MNNTGFLARSQSRTLRKRGRRSRSLVFLFMSFLIIGASLGAFWIVKAHGTAANQQDQTQSTYTSELTAVHRTSNEQPISTVRSYSLIPSLAATTMLPWATVFDYTNGYTWVAEPGCEPLPKCTSSIQGILGQYALSDGTFIEDHMEPTGFTSPLFAAIDANSNIWFTEPTSDAIGEYNVMNDTWQQWPVKRGSAPYDLLIDSHGNLWFTEFEGNAIGYFNTSTHALVETAIPTEMSDPYGMTFDPKGNIWFAENGEDIDQIGYFTPTNTGHVKITEVSVNGSRPHLITADKFGNIWFSEGFDGDIGEFVPSTGAKQVFRVYPGSCTPELCPGTHISGIRADSTGNIWFTDSLSQYVGYYVPSTGKVVLQRQEPNAHPHDGLSIDKYGRVWFTEQDTFKLSMKPLSAFK